MATATAAASRRVAGAGPLTGWMWTWVTLGVLVVLVVVGFLVGIVSSLENIDSNLAEANSAVSGAGGDGEAPSGPLADLNREPDDVDPSLKPVPAPAGP